MRPEAFNRIRLGRSDRPVRMGVRIRVKKHILEVAMRVFPFDRIKFKELMLYVAGEVAGDPTFGAVKLNKILFNADQLAYAELGRPITGARYQRLQNGPTARALLPLQEELLNWGDAELEFADHYGNRQVRLVAMREPRTDLFSPEELEITDRAIKAMWGLEARTVSDLSHLEKGWQIVNDGEDIPYEAVFLSSEDPSQEAVERGRRLAKELGLLTR